MAKLIYICPRDERLCQFSEKDINLVSQRLVPDHISASVYTKKSQDGIIISIAPFNDSVKLHDHSVGLGCIQSQEEKWWQIGNHGLDGSYALFRSDRRTVEIVSDALASRSIWYIKTKKYFFASTSQRAVIALLGNYEPNDEILSWYLSNGYSGPGMSWDKRLKMVKPDSRIILNRQTWKLSEITNPILFNEVKRSNKEHYEFLRSAIQESFGKMDLKWNQWVLALSGGYDSRCSLIMLKNHIDMKCVTWGDRRTAEMEGTDTNIAPRLAQKYGFPHEYCFTDRTSEPIEKIFNRALHVGEGRVDHINSSMDGFLRYKQMHDSGFFGLIRSDIGFGWVPVVLKSDVPSLFGFIDLKDYENLYGYGLENFPLKTIPENLLRHPKESLSTWRDRLYHSYRVSTFLSGLAEARLSYIEQANPLLSRTIIMAVRTLPDKLRTSKALLKTIVNKMESDIPIANSAGIPALGNLLNTTEIREMILDELSSINARNIFPSQFLKRLQNDLHQNRPNTQNQINYSKLPLVSKMPTPVKTLLGAFRRKCVKPQLNKSKLPLRSFIITKMNTMLSDDANTLNAKLN